ncbi:MAG: hypothetical protein Greene041619_1192 [Candidatus Peregrinibacteria bacterium Greene0416_19]|nr:MAG: hypothetical protein Greene041619_1192 [Candidatus Peregrinibacteria bacterium Greene0416_19]
MFVVTLPKTATADPASFARKAKEAGADLVEVRADLTSDIQPFISPLPMIVSPRGTGIRLVTLLRPAYVDLQLGEEMSVSPGMKIIRSFHDFEKTPELLNLLPLMEKMRATKADIIKIATKINAYADLHTLDLLRDGLPTSQGRCILGMGLKAHLSRLLSPLKNTLTYTYLNEGEQSAAGQVPLSLHQLTSHCRTPKIFGLLGGNAAAQSLSPLIQNTLFSLNGIDAIYSLFLTDDLDDAFDELVAREVAGFSVTSPFKQSVLRKLEQVDCKHHRLRRRALCRLRAGCAGHDGRLSISQGSRVSCHSWLGWGRPFRHPSRPDERDKRHSYICQKRSSKDNCCRKIRSAAVRSFRTSIIPARYSYFNLIRRHISTAPDVQGKSSCHRSAVRGWDEISTGCF